MITCWDHRLRSKLVQLAGGERRMKRLLNFISLLRIEPYIFINRMSSAIKMTPLAMLQQDKICRQVYNQTVDTCYHLPKMRHHLVGGANHTDVKSMILAETATFENYYLIVKTLPGLVWILFLGPWLDRYVEGRKILLMVSVLGGIVETAVQIYMAVNFKIDYWYLLLAALPPALTGGQLGGHLAASNYITMTTPPKQMALRFMIYELCLFTATPIGTAVGGFLLNIRPTIFDTDEILNYSITFIISIILKIIALAWIWFMIDEQFMKKKQDIVEMKLAKLKGLEPNKAEDKPNKTEDQSDKQEKDKRHPIKQLFDLSNLKEMMTCCFKPRPGHVRAQILALLVCMTVSHTAHAGKHFLMPFSQKIYLWSSDWYSYVRSIAQLTHGLATMTLVPVMVNVLLISDIRLAVIGYVAKFLDELLIGTILKPWAYYVGIGIMSISGISFIGIKAHYSKIIELNEVGKVFGLISCIDHLAPMFSSTFYTKIFNWTMDSHPGAVFQIMAATMLIPIGMLIWIDCRLRPKSSEESQDKCLC